VRGEKKETDRGSKSRSNTLYTFRREEKESSQFALSLTRILLELQPPPISLSPKNQTKYTSFQSMGLSQSAQIRLNMARIASDTGVSVPKQEESDSIDEEAAVQTRLTKKPFATKSSIGVDGGWHYLIIELTEHCGCGGSFR